MKNKIKKFIAFTLTLSMLAVCSVSAFAQEDSTHATGLIWDTWEVISAKMDTDVSYLKAYAQQRIGDIDNDGKITATDARMCLRESAKLESLNSVQFSNADVNNDNHVDSIDARLILRAAAKLEALSTATIDTTADWGFVIGALETAGSGRYYWQCSIDADGLNYKEYSIIPDTELIGAPAEQYFVFTPESEGTYTVNFKLSDTHQQDIIDEFQIIVAVENE